MILIGGGGGGGGGSGSPHSLVRPQSVLQPGWGLCATVHVCFPPGAAASAHAARRSVVRSAGTFPRAPYIICSVSVPRGRASASQITLTSLQSDHRLALASVSGPRYRLPFTSGSVRGLFCWGGRRAIAGAAVRLVTQWVGRL